MTRADVVVVGGGFAGMCAARSLASGGRRVVVLEALSGPAATFRGELAHPLAVETLVGLGLFAPLTRAGAISVLGFAVGLDARREPIPLPYAEISAGRTRGLIMPHAEMVECLRREVAGSGSSVELRMGSRVTDLLMESGEVVGVRTAAGDEVRAPLTIVSDGRHSKLRSLIGAAEETRLLSFTAAVLTDPTPLPHEEYAHVFLGDWGPILAYALGSGAVRVCIDLPVDLGKGASQLRGFVSRACAPALPEPLRGALLDALEREAPELCATHAITTRRCTAPGVALVGDAAGCAHPLTAGGMTIALNDIATLARELDRSPSTDVALARYEARRYAFVRAREVLVEVLYDLFRRDDEGARALRRGLSRYWRSGRRARRASLSLLSGRDSRMSSFLAEYLAVVGASAWTLLSRSELQPRGRRTAARSLAQTTGDQLACAAKLLYQNRSRRPSPRVRESLRAL